MAHKTTLVEDMQRIVNESGGKAIEIAKLEIASKFASNDDVSLALKYFAQMTLRGVLPVFPALVSLSCEAVGGKPDKTDAIGGAITLIAGAADLHDDVIDESPVKNGKRTVFGRFGKEVTILAGDALLGWGLARLQRECEAIPAAQGRRVLDLLTDTIIEMSHAEALEARLRAVKNASTENCMNVIELKAVVPEVNMKIGAILGNGDNISVKALGQFGKVFGIVSTVAEEFMDVLEYEELKNRFRDHYPPLPVLCALKDPELKAQILGFSKKLTTRRKFEELKELVLDSPEAHKLKKDMNIMVQTELECMSSATKIPEAHKKLKIILTSALELLEGIDR
jgi:geranylgeranyl pyrophosphate synthase